MRLPLVASLLLAASAVSGADTAAVEPAAPDATQSLPARGMAQAQVLRQYGEPSARHAPVGGESPQHPPITRWDYPGFSVFFEHAHVVHAVIPGKPAPLFHTEQLGAPATPNS